MNQLNTVISNPTGLHARPAAQLSAFCKKFPNNIELSCEERKCNPKSIFSLLGCCFKQGESVTISVDGEGSEEAAKQIADFINSLEG